MSGPWNSLKRLAMPWTSGGILNPAKPAAAPVTPRTVITEGVIDTSAREAARMEAERLRKKRGFQSTILTGPLGITEEANVRRQTLG